MLSIRFIEKLTSTIAVAGVAAAVTFSAAAADSLKFASWVPAAHTITEGVVDPLIKALEEGTGGATDIDYFTGGELGAGPLEQYVRVVQGVADMSWGLPGYTSSQFPKTMISELPGVKGDKPGYELLWNAYDAGLLEKEFPGVKPLALWLSEPNVFIMKDHEIRTPEDVKGLKIRVSGTIAGDVIAALGGTPVQIPAGELYNALQTGLIDGLVTGTSAIGDFKLDEVANSYTYNVPLGQISFYTIMNQAAYDGLSAEAKAAIDGIAGRTLSKSAEDAWNRKAEAVLESMKAAGDNTIIVLSDEESAAFEELVLPVTDKAIGQLGAEEVYKTMRGEM
ncbi:TRAP transporter substrate-binding protein [Oricola thermophila]|uniref:TRAP transporter substrate-binding protein n=1 Tax=Oricola thermophila TaxID=2742145 RepID=A0A6N1V9U6_9HYPH|nr:TRAP transporter substrate-binding protein [Oricola thermophila]QKV17293.1 TRAP transporter substrate-binding protein [Oricola thermophila]